MQPSTTYFSTERSKVGRPRYIPVNVKQPWEMGRASLKTFLNSDSSRYNLLLGHFPDQWNGELHLNASQRSLRQPQSGTSAPFVYSNDSLSRRQTDGREKKTPLKNKRE